MEIKTLAPKDIGEPTEEAVPETHSCIFSDQDSNSLFWQKPR